MRTPDEEAIFLAENATVSIDGIKHKAFNGMAEIMLPTVVKRLRREGAEWMREQAAMTADEVVKKPNGGLFIAEAIRALPLEPEAKDE